MRLASVSSGHHALAANGTRHPPNAFAPLAPWLRSTAPCIQQYNALRYIADAQQLRRPAIASTQPSLVDEDVDTPTAGPALEATLQALEWHRLCEDLASFAKTSLGSASFSLSLRCVVENTSNAGKQQLRALHPCQVHNTADTAAAIALVRDLAADVDFGGVATGDALEALRRVVKGGVASGPQLNALAATVTSASRLQRMVQQAARAAASDASIVAALRPLADAMAALELPRAVVDDVRRCLEEEDGRVRDTASEQVRRTRARVTTLANRIRGVLRGYAGEVTEVGGRLALAVAQSEADRVVKGVVLGSSAGGALLYVEPGAVVPTNNELAAARGEAYAAEETVLSQLSMRCAALAASLEAVLDALIWLDVAVAKAEYGLWIGGHLSQEGFWPHERALQPSGAVEIERGEEVPLVFRLKQLRHPLLLAAHLRDEEQRRRLARGASSSRRLSGRKATPQEAAPPQEPVPAPVPVDMCVPPGLRALIITGPNTGGKTATIKAVGLAVLMAQCGIPVPAQHPVVLPPVSSVLADVGDEQSLEASLSTFSGHLRRIQAIRAESDGASLVLLDEVGTGTDPVEGSALGLALLRALVRGGFGGAGFVVATTHHSALTGLKYEDPRFENASVGFDEIVLAPTYRLQWGVPGRSNALNIAARLGLEPAVVADARAQLGVAQAEVNQGIAALEDLRAEADAHEQAVTGLLEQQAMLQRRLRAARRAAAQRAAVATVQQRNEVAAACDRALVQLQDLEAQQEAAERGAAREAAREEQQRREEAKAAVRAARKAAFKPKAGGRVLVPRLNSVGKVVKVVGDKLTVQVGLLKVELGRNEVEPP